MNTGDLVKFELTQVAELGVYVRFWKLSDTNFMENPTEGFITKNVNKIKPNVKYNGKIVKSNVSVIDGITYYDIVRI